MLLHYTTWSETADFLLGVDRPLVLLYHNVTPPEFFAGLDPSAEETCRLGRERLADFAERTQLAVAKSEFSRRDLVAAGFRRTSVLPVRLDFETLDRACNRDLLAQIVRAGPGMLFVGRIVPNKGIDDLIKVFAYYRRIQPDARLYCVGAHTEHSPYQAYLRWLIRSLRLDGAVTFTGQVPHPERGAYYRGCRVFVSMSEHEGFGVPPIEAMHLGLPVVAYAAGAIPETVGDAAVLVNRKRHDVIAEIVAQATADGALRNRLIARGREQAGRYSPAVVEARFAGLMDEALNDRS